METDRLRFSNTLFEQPWWLEAAAPGAWEEVRLLEGSTCVGRFPYARKRRNGLTTIGHPVLTPALGPWLVAQPDGQSSASRDRATALIQSLPSFDYALFRFPAGHTDWLPFAWAGFRGTYGYTYRIEDPSDPEEVISGFSRSARRRLRKAADQLEVRAVDDASELSRLSDLAFAPQGIRTPYSRKELDRLLRVASERQQGAALVAVDAQENVHVAEFGVWDRRSLYLLASARNPEVPDKSATTLTTASWIHRASALGVAVDFAGSMIKGVEAFNRSLGARQVPVIVVEKESPRRRAAAAGRGLAQFGAQVARRGGSRLRGLAARAASSLVPALGVSLESVRVLL